MSANFPDKKYQIIYGDPACMNIQTQDQLKTPEAMLNNFTKLCQLMRSKNFQLKNLQMIIAGYFYGLHILNFLTD